VFQPPRRYLFPPRHLKGCTSCRPKNSPQIGPHPVSTCVRVASKQMLPSTPSCPSPASCVSQQLVTEPSLCSANASEWNGSQQSCGVRDLPLYLRSSHALYWEQTPPVVGQETTSLSRLARRQLKCGGHFLLVFESWNSLSWLRIGV
jgi:hypothetical protein